MIHSIGEPRSRAIWIGSLACVSIVCVARAEERSSTAALPTRLFIVEDQGVARYQEPVAGGIPLPPGAVHDPAELRVWNAAGLEVPCQVHQLGLSWPDGSLRWALLQFQATVGANESAQYRLGVSQIGQRVRPPSRVTVSDKGTHVEVTTGPMRFWIARKEFTYQATLRRKHNATGAPPQTKTITESFRLPNKVWINESGNFTDDDLVLEEGAWMEMVADREFMSTAEFQATGAEPRELTSFGLADSGEVVFAENGMGGEYYDENRHKGKPRVWNRVTRGIDYSQFFTGEVHIAVEEAGPLRAVMRIETAGEKKEGEVSFVARVYAYAGKELLRIELTVVNHEVVRGVPGYLISNVKHIQKLSYHLKPGFYPSESVEYGTQEQSVTVAAGQPSSLLELRDDAYVAVEGGGATVAEGARAPGWMTVRSGANSTTLAAKYFWEIYPKALAYDAASGEMRLDLWPEAAGAGYPLALGRARTYEFLIGFDVSGPETSAMARAELRAYPDPEYVAATGATHRFVPLSDERFSLYADYVRRAYERRMGSPGTLTLYGDIDFGDTTGWTGASRYNNYHGPAHEYFLWYLASGEPKYFRIAEAHAWHSMDVDTSHWGELNTYGAAGSREAEYSRSPDHLDPFPHQGGIKVWNFGEVDYYFLTGKRRVLDILPDTINFLMHTGGCAPPFSAERATSLPFMHHCYMYEAIGSEEAVNQLYPGTFAAKGGYPHRTDSLGAEKSLVWLKRMKEMSDYFCDLFGERQDPAFFAGPQSSLAAAYSPEALYRYWTLTKDGEATKAVARIADFYYNGRTRILPTGLHRHGAGNPESSAYWLPCHLDVMAAATHAYQVTGDKKYLDYGKASVDNILNYYHFAYSWEGFGRAIPPFLWAMRDAGLPQNGLTKMREDLDYDQAVAACKEVALAHKEATGEQAGVFSALAQEVGRVLINLGRYDQAIQWLDEWKTYPASKEAYQIETFLRRARELKDAHAGQR